MTIRRAIVMQVRELMHPRIKCTMRRSSLKIVVVCTTLKTLTRRANRSTRMALKCKWKDLSQLLT